MDADVVKKNLEQHIVKDLVGKHHKVFFNNYLNSVQFQRDLLADGCGTIRKGRSDYPEFKVDKSMKSCDID